MKRLFYYLPMHFLCALILGICFQFFYKLWKFGFLNLLYVFLILVVFMLTNQKKITTFFAFLLFFFVGISSVYVHNQKNYQNYYFNFKSDNTVKILKIDKVLKSNSYYDKYEAKVIQIDSLLVRGRVLVNIQKDSISPLLKVDESLIFKEDFQEIKPPLNPHQFDYKFYLSKKGIHEQVFLKSNTFLNLGIHRSSLKGWSAKFRTKVQQALKKHDFSADEFGVINALLLGQRQEISNDLIEDYSSAGAIHILAVSGLHVGIILWILSSILQPLERLKYGRFIKMVFIVLLLWMFAFIAGLSASVVRAVTMFMFVSFGLFVNKKKVIEFSLISSMFFLLVFNPMFLFEVGFQLSYLAVFGIVWVQPKVFKMIKTKNKVMLMIWQLLSVSIAAQVGVLPLSLYYFHQFPGLFFLSNLLIIPFLGAILIGGIAVIFLALLGILPHFLVIIYGTVISLMNNFVAFISHQESFLFTEIPFSFSLMITFYVLLLFGIRYALQRSPRKLVYFLSTVILLQGVLLWEKFQKTSKKELIIFHKTRQSIIAKRFANQMIVNNNLNGSDAYIINNYKVGEGIKEIEKQNFQNVFNFQNQSFLVVDSLGIYQLKNLKKPMVILQHSPKINLERLIKVLQPKQIIADGSNYKSYVHSWEKSSRKYQIPFYSTVDSGAYIFKK